MARSINKNILNDDQMLVDYLRDQEREVTAAHQKVDDLQRNTAKALGTSNQSLDVRSLQSGGATPINVTGLIGQLAEPQYAKAPPLLTAHPDLMNVPYDWYVLSGAPNTLWGIDRTTNPPSKYQIV